MNVNRFPISRCQDSVICPVSNLNLHVKLCDLMKINLREGYLFRALIDANAVSDSPFVGAAVANRLKTHLQMANIHGGETMHSFKKWMRHHTLFVRPQPRRHCQTCSLEISLDDGVLFPDRESHALTEGCSHPCEQYLELPWQPTQAIKAAAAFYPNNELTGFKPAF